MTETNIKVTTNDDSDLRIESYKEHLWFRPPADLRNHFDTERRGVFEVSPPCFEYKEIEGESLSFTFKWGCDLNNLDIPRNEQDIEEHLWVKSIRGLKYLHPSRAFNKMMRHKYPGLWENQHFKHVWNDSGDVVTLTISWNLNEYIKPEKNDG